jgi:hypothetical protein
MLKFRDILPFIDMTRPFVIIDRNGNHTTVDNAAVLHDIGRIALNAELMQKGGLGTYRFDMYAEEDMLAIKLNFDQTEGELI